MATTRYGGLSSSASPANACALAVMPGRHRTADALQAHALPGKSQCSLGQFVVPIELRYPLTIGGPREWHGVVDPARHGLPTDDVEIRIVQFFPQPSVGTNSARDRADHSHR